jgi:hypothetical protein
MGKNTKVAQAEPFLLFHWSPTSRRRQINRRGFVPSSRSVDGVWRPPYICFSESPSLAWVLSGANHSDIKEWDLWMTWSNVPSGMESIEDTDPTDGTHYVKEWRVYERIYKRDIWYVATRQS